MVHRAFSSIHTTCETSIINYGWPLVHYCPDTIRSAAKEQIIVFALPPNMTHLMQPLDKGVSFKSMLA